MEIIRITGKPIPPEWKALFKEYPLELIDMFPYARFCFAPEGYIDGVIGLHLEELPASLVRAIIERSN